MGFGGGRSEGDGIPSRDAPEPPVSEPAWLEPPQPQDLLLTLLADNVRHRHERVWSGGIVRLLGVFDFSAGASRVALARLVHRHLLEREKVGRTVRYRMTTRAEELLREGDDTIFTLGRADSRDDSATIVFHTLPEELRVQRSRLARRLRFLRFGSVQDGIWVCMGDREEEVLAELERLDVTAYCSVVVGRLSDRPGLQPLVDRAWDLPALAARYETFVAAFAPYRHRPPADDRDAFCVRTKLMHTFRQFPLLDPGVGGRWWPVPPSRAQAVDLFAALYTRLAPPAHRYFDAVTDIETAGVR